MLSKNNWMLQQICAQSCCAAAMVTLAMLMALSALEAHGGVITYSDEFSGDSLGPFWKVSNGIPNSTVVQDNGTVTITNPVAPSGDWLDTDIVSTDALPDANFIASVDFRVPQGGAMAWLAVREIPNPNDENRHLYGVYLWNNQDYNVWYNNDRFRGFRFGRRAFQDEMSVWHNLKLDYNSRLQQISAFVDDELIHTASANFSEFEIALKMKDRDFFGPGPSVIEFDNFQLEYGFVPEPTSLLLFGMAGLAFAIRNRKLAAN